MRSTASSSWKRRARDAMDSTMGSWQSGLVTRTDETSPPNTFTCTNQPVLVWTRLPLGVWSFCGDENNPYDYFIKLYDPLDRTSALGGYLTQSSFDGQDSRDSGSAYVHLYYRTSRDLIARWMMIPTEDGSYQIAFKNQHGTIRNPDPSRKILLCFSNWWGNVEPSPVRGGRDDTRDDHSAYAHVRIEDDHMGAFNWSLEVVNWNAILSAHFYCQQEQSAKERQP